MKGRPQGISPELRARIAELHQQYGLRAREIAGVLEAADVPAPAGGVRWHASSITRALSRQGIHSPRGRPRRPLTWPRLAEPTPLHQITAMAWRRRRAGSGSNLWELLPGARR